MCKLTKFPFKLVCIFCQLGTTWSDIKNISDYFLISNSPILGLLKLRLCNAECVSIGGAENDGHENDGPSKCPGMKLTDMKMQDMFQVSE